MDYEQKYNKMLDDARYWHDVSEGDIPAVLEEIFPELRESEDEKTRKALISFLKSPFVNENITDEKVTPWLAWLEKQGTSYTKKDVDDAYVEGMAFAKDELEKQKLTWSEEDEVRLQACIDILQAKSIMGKVDTIHTNWLKSIKNRIKGE